MSRTLDDDDVRHSAKSALSTFFLGQTRASAEIRIQLARPRFSFAPLLLSSAVSKSAGKLKHSVIPAFTLHYYSFYTTSILAFLQVAVTQLAHFKKLFFGS